MPTPHPMPTGRRRHGHDKTKAKPKATVSAQGARAPAVPAGGVQVRTVAAHAVQQWQALVPTQGAQAALVTVLQDLVRRGMRRSAASPVLTEAEWATLLGRALVATDPARALQAVRHGLALDGSQVEAWLLLGNVQDKLGDRLASRDTMLRLLDLPNAEPAQRLAAANMLVRLGEQAIAQKAGLQAYEDLGRPLDKAAVLLYIVQRTAHWPTIDALTEQLREAYRDGLFETVAESPRTHLNWCGDETFNVAVISGWSQRQFLPVQPPPKAPAPLPLAGRRLRVGYLSSDYREHPTARLIKGLLRQHDRSRVEVLLYCSGWDDGSAVRKEVLAMAEAVHTVTHMSDAEAAALIRSHGVDVLVELNGPTRAHRMGVLAYRPAPVQVDYLGFPGSVGGNVVDYVVADPSVLPPGQEALYPERVIRLSHTYQANDYAAQPRPVPPARSAVGLPAGDWQVLGVFNGIEKVHTQVWATWMEILRHSPRALIWLLDPGPVAWAQVQAATRAHGIDPARILKAPRQKQEAHLARMGCCDLMLDPWPYGGHTTTADALFAGVPVLAMQGTNFASRVSGGLLRAAGLPALVAPDVNAYVLLAINLLRDRKALAQVQSVVREVVPGSPLFDSTAKARQMEAAYRALVQRVIEGLPPEHTDALACLRAEAASGLWPVVPSGQAGQGAAPKGSVLASSPPPLRASDPTAPVAAAQPQEQPVTMRYLTSRRPPSEGVVVFSMLKDEQHFMPHFLAHYRGMGVAGFLLLDDGSSDGTREYLMAQHDCTVLEASHHFADQVNGQPFHTWVKQNVPHRLLASRWVLTVDADEFLVLPPPLTSVAQWCERLDAQGINHVRALMLDFFPEQLADLDGASPTASPWELCPWVDVPAVVDWPAGAAAPRGLSVRDCIRPRLVHTLLQEWPQLRKDLEGYKLANLNKVPLLKWEPGVAAISDHRVSVPVSDQNQAVLAHFKFYPGWLAKARRAVADATHWNGAIEYRMLSEAGARMAARRLPGPHSHRYQGPAQLAALNMLFASPADAGAHARADTGADTGARETAPGAKPQPAPPGDQAGAAAPSLAQTPAVPAASSVAARQRSGWLTVQHVRFEPGYWRGMRQPAVLLQVGLGQQPVSPHALQAFDAMHSTVCPTLEHGEMTVPVEPSVGAHPVMGRLLQFSVDVLARIGMPVMGGAKAVCTDASVPLRWMVGLPAVSAVNSAPQAVWALAGKLLNNIIAGNPVSVEGLEAEISQLAQRFQPLAPAGVNTVWFLQAAHDLEIPWCHVAKNIYQFGWGRHSRWLDSSFTDETPAISAGLARDKVATAQVLRAAGLPVPQHHLVSSAAHAVQVASALGYPVVIKPANLDGGSGVLAGVREAAGVKRGYEAASKLSKRVLVEQFIAGNDYRVRICKGEVIAAVIRRPAAVVGDGASTIQVLIDRINAQRQSGSSPPDTFIEQGFNPITVDEEVRQWLADQGLGLDSVVPSGHRVQLRGAANVSLGGTTQEVTPQAHPDNLSLAVQAAAALRLDVAGVDLLVPDITQSWRQTGGAICEVNAQPQFSRGPTHRILLERLVRRQGRIPVVAMTGLPPDGALQQAVLQGLRDKGVQVEWVTTTEQCLQALRRADLDGLVWQVEGGLSPDSATPVDALAVWVYPHGHSVSGYPEAFEQTGERWELHGDMGLLQLADRLVAFFTEPSHTVQRL